MALTGHTLLLVLVLASTLRGRTCSGTARSALTTVNPMPSSLTRESRVIAAARHSGRKVRGGGVVVSHTRHRSLSFTHLPLAQIMQTEVAAGRAQPFIAVVVKETPLAPRDTECAAS